jgi:cell cycle checkpoint protein
MDSSLHQVWQAAAGSPFLPAVGKESHFILASILFSLSLAATGVFALSKF